MKNTKHLTVILISFLIVSMLTISIGFSAMSTTLTVNGVASFKPIDMIRVVGIDMVDEVSATDIKSGYKPTEANMYLSIDNIDGYITYKIQIRNLGEVDKVLSNINNDIFSNDEITYEVTGFKVGDVIRKKETKEMTIKFKYVANASLTDTYLNSKLTFDFEDYVYVPAPLQYSYQVADCTFYGKNINTTGSCGSESSYIDTGIRLFSEENYQKNFIMTFTLTDIDDSRLVKGKQDTFMNALYEANDSTGRYPGILFRVEDQKLNMHISNGQATNYSYDLKFTKEEFLGKEFKLIRYNDGETIKLYYTLDGDGPHLLMDITNLYKTFDTTLTFGAGLEKDNRTTLRDAIGTLENISLAFVTKEEALREFNKTITPVEDDIIFDLAGPCTFNGKTSNIVGCEEYADYKNINTGVYLFNDDNYSKDFDMRFTLSNYVSSEQPEAQVTIMNAFLERTGKGYGLLIRRAGNNLNLIARDGNGLEKSITINVADTNEFRIVRKNNNLCYSLNGSKMNYIINYNNFTAPFNVPVTFGSSIDSKGVSWRYIKGDMSSMYIKVGNIDPEIICTN